MSVAGSGLYNATVIINESSIDVSPGMTLFDCAESQGINVPTSCHKQGKCRECLLEIEEGAQFLSEPAPQESHLSGRFRLACRTRLTAPGTVRCHTLRRGSLRIETEARDLSLGSNFDPAVARQGSQVLLDGDPLTEFDGAIHGIALDIGTTTVVLRLYDLESGESIATNSFENPQRFGGSDIMSRIRYDGEHGGRLLQRTLLGYLSRAIAEMPATAETIFEIVVVGNPTMRDLFLGLDVQSIGVLPYRSTSEAAWRSGLAAGTSISLQARKLRLPVHPAARVYALPLIGSHVGADAAACLLATNLGAGSEICALLDIGTNTEAFLGNSDRLLAASCPAGPAFEGGGVTCGMPALEGAIERVRIGPDGSADTTVIGRAPAMGICGSGLVDLLSELRRSGFMNEQGRLTQEEEYVVDQVHGISFGESDINELAQAKGANAAGLRVLAAEFGIPLSGIDRLYLAGGFARYIDIDAACRIGLIPDLPRERIVKVGNAALHGAATALLSRTRRQVLEEKVKRVQHVRLEAHPRFFDFFVEGCQFRPFGGAE